MRLTSSRALLACALVVGCGAGRRATSDSARAKSPASAQRAGEGAPRLSATSSFRAWYDSTQHCTMHRVVNQTFAQGEGYVLLYTEDDTSCPTAEGFRDSITVQRWEDDSLGGPPRYRIAASGDAVRRRGAVFEVVSSGSGGGSDFFEYYSVESGAKVLESLAPAILLDLYAAPWRRYLAITQRELQYGDGRHATRRVRIENVKEPSAAYCPLHFGFVRAGTDSLIDSLHVHTDPSATRDSVSVPDFTVRAELAPCFDDGDAAPFWIVVPFTRDAPDLAHAQTSEGIRLTVPAP